MTNYITKVEVKNYRSLADTTVELSQLTVLIGKNGSGKSNFVDVLRFVSEALISGLDSAIIKRGGIGRIRRWSSGRPFDVTIGLWIVIDGVDHEYRFTLRSDRRNEYHVKGESYSSNGRVVFERKETHFEYGKSVAVQPRGLALPLLATAPEIESLYRFLVNMRFYTIFPNTLRPPQNPADPYPLAEHGENFASALREFIRERGENNEIVNYLGRIVAGINGIRVIQVGTYLVVRLKHENSGEFDLVQESDGTLRILGILLALFQKPPQTLVAIEEPELTIYPGAAALLCDVIKEASERSQIIITTHSPDLISRFPVDELRIVEHTGDGTRIGPIDETQREAIKAQLFSTSDLLRIDGELRRAPTDDEV